MQCVEGNPRGKKQHTVPNVCQNRRPYRPKTLFQFSASPALILRTTENATFAHFMKKSMHLKTGFLSDNQVFFLLLNRPQIGTSLLFNRSISIDLWRQKVPTRWFCPLPKKNGAICSAKQTKDCLIWVLLVKREHILAFYRPNFKRQT